LRIAVPRALPGPDAVTLSHDELALVGQLVGSGRVTSEGRLRFETRSSRHAADIAALASAVCRKNIAVWPARSGAYCVDVDPGRRWLRRLGIRTAAGALESVPEPVFRQANAGVATFLRHLWASGGHVSAGASRRRTGRFSSPSERLARDALALLLRLRIPASIRPAGAPPGAAPHVR